MSDGIIDGARIKDAARELAFPRYAGTEGCALAQGIVASWLRELPLEVTEEEFSYDVRPAFRLIRIIALASGLLVGAAGWVALHAPAVAAILLVAGLLVGGVPLVFAPGAEAIYRGGGPTVTANVAGRRRAAKPRKTIIVMAHYDSKSQNLTLPWRNAPIALALLTTVALAGVIAVGAVASRAPGPAWLPPALGSVAAACLFLLSTLSSGNDSPGGVDNAGSVAIVRELARALPQRVPDDVELIFLSPSAEEDHMIGAMRWLDRHVEELRGRPVYALNFDGAGAPGRPLIMEGYGLFHRFAPEIARVTVEASRRLGLDLRRIWLPPAMGVDAIPFHHRGVPCLTISSGSLGKATMSVHSRHDVADHLDPATLASCARLGLEVAAELAR